MAVLGLYRTTILKLQCSGRNLCLECSVRVVTCLLLKVLFTHIIFFAFVHVYAFLNFTLCVKIRVSLLPAPQCLLEDHLPILTAVWCRA